MLNKLKLRRDTIRNHKNLQIFKKNFKYLKDFKYLKRL